MTDPERHGPGVFRRGVSRRAATLVAAVAIIAVAIGLSVALGVGPTSTTPIPTAPGIGLGGSPALGDLPLVTVAPDATRGPTASPSDPGAATASPSLAAPLERGIRANRIRIARLGIDLAVVEGDGVDAPIGKAAHYPGSAWPGDGSNIYVYGHARVGMFITLWQARVGDPITLDLVDGTSRTYVVTKILPKVPYNAVTYLEPTRTEQLTLQTSTSYYPTAPRFVVIAVPAP
jgi:LPXTG-site transpeptidase (sortase) family protein